MMHDKRNFALMLVLVVLLVWAFLAWFAFGSPDEESGRGILIQRIAATGLAVLVAGWLVYGMVFEDKLPDYLREVVGQIYYEADGLSFLPMVRVHGDRAELCVYYQNRFEGPVEAVVHLRPLEDCSVIREGWRDVHFAFKADGGDFGAIHQPISVPENLRVEVLNVQLAAASWYPRSHGSRLRKQGGMPCGTLLVDWGGAAFKTGVHEVSGEIELQNPVMLHLPMPKTATAEHSYSDTWRQERVHAGNVG